jgi:hypothetical protein
MPLACSDELHVPIRLPSLLSSRRIRHLEHLDHLILRPRSEQPVVRREVERVDVLVVDLLSEERLEPGGGWGGEIDRGEIPHLNGSVLRGSEEELGLERGGRVVWSFAGEGDGAYRLGMTFADGDALPLSGFIVISGRGRVEGPDAGGAVFRAGDEPRAVFGFVEAKDHVSMTGEETSVEGFGRVDADEGGVGGEGDVGISPRGRRGGEEEGVDDFVVVADELASEGRRGVGSERMEEYVLVRVDRDEGGCRGVVAARRIEKKKRGGGVQRKLP